MSPPEKRWPAIEASAVSVPAHVVFREIAQETVLLNVDTYR